MRKIMCMVLAAICSAIMLTACAGEQGATVSTDGSTSMEKVIGALGESFMRDN